MLSASLPPPPEGKSGWPWNQEIEILPGAPLSGEAWPKISIVTPSFNQGAYLEETIRSIVLQGYPNLEFIIMDGGSKDETVSIIKKYGGFIDYWVSEPDEGQSDAINRGFDRSTGEIITWVCSDDMLMPGALKEVATAFLEDNGCDVVVGSCRCIDDTAPEKEKLVNPGVTRVQKMPYAFAVWQPSVFFKRQAVGRTEWVRRDLHFTMDRELWCQLCKAGATWRAIDAPLSINRFTGDNKSLTGQRKIIEEIHEIYSDFEGDRVPLTFWLKSFWVPLIAAQRQRSPGSVIRKLCELGSRSVTLGLRAAYPLDKIRALQKEFYSYAG